MFKYITMLQIIFYVVAFGSGVRKVLPIKNLTKITFYFVMVKHSILMVWYRYLKGERLMTWELPKR
jgi:hypothetical protein